MSEREVAEKAVIEKTGTALYLECYSGISGDMTVAALLDLGASEQVLRETLERLGVDGYEIRIGRTQKCGVDACDFDVILENTEADHESHEHHHPHIHRNYGDIRRLLEQADLKPGVLARALKIFEVVAKAEGKVHGKPMDQVHFHEVGAVDSIVDIVGVAACLEDLGIETIYLSSIYEGTGHVWCQHGKLPVPVPAVAQMAADYGLPMVLTDQQGEMVTPTGAAIVAALAKRQAPRAFSIQKIGIGAGKKDFPKANILRAMLIEPEEQEEIWELQSNIDDCTGEALGYCMECLLEAGARDVYFTPIYMKKCRPAYKLSVLCQESDIRAMEEILFRETTTIGIRRSRMNRSALKRKLIERQVSLGKVQVKVCTFGETVRQYPEYESVRQAAKNAGLSYTEAYKKILGELELQ